MFKTFPRAVVALTTCLLLIGEVAFAKPDFGESCSSCHGTNVGGTNPNKMLVTGFDTILDIDTQLNGKTRGPLSTYLASPGDTVTFQMTVTDNSEEYGIQLKRLYKPGQLILATNFLTNPMYGTTSSPPWTNSGGDPVNGPQWYYQGPFDDDDDHGDDHDDGDGDSDADSSGSVYYFDLILDPNTPPDVYDLEFAIAGGHGFESESWYQDEHFYLQVVGSIPEPNTFALAVLGAISICTSYLKRRR